MGLPGIGLAHMVGRIEVFWDSTLAAGCGPGAARNLKKSLAFPVDWKSYIVSER